MCYAIMFSSAFTVNVLAGDTDYCDLTVSAKHRTLDFYNPDDNKSGTIVTDYHLTTDMLLLKTGSTGSISDDLHYTLEHIPNHPQALDLASRLQIAVKNGFKQPGEKPKRTADCYFARAIEKNRKSGETYYLWGLHLQRNGEYPDSAKKYDKAEALGLNNAEFHYNYGLLYYSLGNYELANGRAARAYSQGFPLEGLRKKLESKGYSK